VIHLWAALQAFVLAGVLATLHILVGGLVHL
jgi:hypothetical protein